MNLADMVDRLSLVKGRTIRMRKIKTYKLVTGEIKREYKYGRVYTREEWKARGNFYE